MTPEEVLKIFRESGALLEGHFKLTSGLHSAQYFQCAKVLQYPWHAQKLCWEIAYNYMTDKVTAVIAPAIGGIIVAQEVARLIRARSIFAEREQGKMTLRRGFEINPDDVVLIVEDVVTTGGSVNEIVELVQQSGASLKGIGFIVDRSMGRANFPVATFSLLKMDVIVHKPEECPLCKKGVPLIKPGSRTS
jgi:orotate phosphoribosyltransferase